MIKKLVYYLVIMAYVFVVMLITEVFLIKCQPLFGMTSLWSVPLLFIHTLVSIYFSNKYILTVISIKRRFNLKIQSKDWPIYFIFVYAHIQLFIGLLFGSSFKIGTGICAYLSVIPILMSIRSKDPFIREKAYVFLTILLLIYIVLCYCYANNMIS